MNISRLQLIGQGEMLPRFYRVAYYDPCRELAVCFPFGIHWIVMFAHWLYEATIIYNPTRLEKYIQEAYRRGKAEQLENDNQILYYHTGHSNAIEKYTRLKKEDESRRGLKKQIEWLK
ncbi:MAG TPA: hypothetical protein VMW38_11745 [Terriglobia bacterium]|nr:hypothetical protein [Terriglobia bacterium]